MEGLWTVRFLGAGDPDMTLNGGVAVIETQQLLGGDSGYYYVGDVTPNHNQGWNVKLTINRHDSEIISIFGDKDTISLEGTLTRDTVDFKQRDRLLANLREKESLISITVQLTRVAALP